MRCLQASSSSGQAQRRAFPQLATGSSRKRVSRPPAGLRRSRGFTLLELILSMGLTAMLLGMLSAGVYAVVNDWRDETSVLDESLDKTLVVLQLERALQSALPHTYIDPDRLARFVYFHGTEETISFVSTVSPQRQNGLTAWHLQSGRDGLELTLTPAFSDNPDSRLDGLEPVLLLPNYSASFRYLLQRNPDTKEWLDEWEGADMQSLPLAIHIVLTPVDESVDTEVLEIVAPVKTWRHEQIDPTLPVF